MKRLAVFLSLLLVATSSHATLVISEIDLANNKVEIVNTGGGTDNLTGYFLCNRLNGSPSFYIALTVGLIDSANSTDTDLLMAPGNVMTLSLAAGFIPDASGEFGLYLNNTGYGTAANMVDYVGWGADGTRDSVAATKGIWASGSFIDVSSIQAGQTIQLKLFEDGGGVADYVLATSTIGVAQSIPEPSTYALGALGALGVIGLIALRMRRRH